MTNPCGESTCDTNRPYTLRTRILHLRWFTYGLIKYRMMQCTGYFKWKGRYMKGPIPEGPPSRRRPPHWIRTPWFWFRGVLGNMEHRLRVLSGWYTISARITFAMLQQKIPPPVKEITQVRVNVDGEEKIWLVSRSMMDRIAKSIGGVR